ncbi:MAG TPA: GNAT family N-acetyltransferase [Anaerolineae bacterium]|nr:GNAT family N-acetyltransferase [Anaerolineae bacterium]
MQTTIYTDASGFELLAQEWDDLFRRSINPPFFMRYIYQRTWWQYLGNDNLVLVAIRADDDQLVGLAPLYTKINGAGQRELSFVGCVDVSDYLDLLVDGDYVEPVYQTLLDCLGSGYLAWDKLYLCSLPHHSITHTRLAETVRSRGWRAEVSQQDVCPVITLPGDWEDYLAGIDKKQRHEIRRKLRKIETEAQTRWYAVESAAEVDEAMAAFIELHQKSTSDKEGFWNESLIQFFTALAAQLAKTGWLKLYFIEVNGTRAAAMLCFDYNNEFLLYNSGFDPEQFAHLSPGNALTAYTIRHAIHLGRQRYDFLRGDEVYKFRFGAVAEPVYDLEIYR